VLARALLAQRASRRIAFKQEFSGEAPGAWCDLIRDIVAIANSGGGVIVVGLDKVGNPTGWDPAAFLAVDPADVVSSIEKYVGEQFDEFEISAAQKAGVNVAAIVVAPRTGSPLVFEKPGTYVDDHGNHETAFARGTVYFRHGAKSEPALARDLASFANTELGRLRRELLKNVRKLSNAPRGSEIVVVSPKGGPATTVDRFRVVDDPSAPAVARTDFDVTHPFRQKELVATINDRAGTRIAGPYEIQCVRRVYDIGSRPEFFHRPKFGSPQYSDAFVSWLITEYQRDPQFFENAKRADRGAGKGASRSADAAEGG
jgi:hypothetical protein